jgi:hypothetical protein
MLLSFSSVANCMIRRYSPLVIKTAEQMASAIDNTKKKSNTPPYWMATIIAGMMERPRANCPR